MILYKLMLVLCWLICVTRAYYYWVFVVNEWGGFLGSKRLIGDDAGCATVSTTAQSPHSINIPCGLEVENSRLWRVAFENCALVNICPSLLLPVRTDLGCQSTVSYP